MSEPLVLVILLGTTGDPISRGMMATARRALGPDAVVLADTSTQSEDADALAIGAGVRARAVARVTCADESCQVARLHVHVGTAAEWEDDEITFLPNDAASEKGRTLGYMLASMVQRIERARIDAEQAASAAPPLSSSASGATRTHPEGLQSSLRREVPAALPAGVDALVHGLGVVGGGATAAGVGAGLRWWPTSHVGFGTSFGARVGSIPDAEATTTTLSVAAGPSYRFLLGRAVELGARADIVLLHHAVARERAVETSRARWLGAVDLMLEARWTFAPPFALFAAAGAELAWGATVVNVGGVAVADIPPARAIFELGLRFRF